MKDGNSVVARVIAALDTLGIDYMLAGSYSSNYYGIPRATRDADFVAVLAGRTGQLAAVLGEEFLVDPQPTFEVVTGTIREMISVPSLAFDVEVFQLSGDAHDQARFGQRRLVFDEDGMGDFWQWRYGIAAGEGGLDPDKDGMTNAE